MRQDFTSWSAIRALVWEQWCHARFLMLLFLAIALLCQQTAFWVLVDHSRIHKTDIPFFADTLLFAVLYIFTLLLALGDSDSNNLSLGFPARMYHHPVSNMALVLTLGLARFAIVVAQTALVFGISHACFPELTESHLAKIIFATMYFFIFFQALAWTLGSYGPFWAFLSGGLGLAAVGITAIAATNACRPIEAFGPFVIAALAGGAFALLLVYDYVKRDRRGQWHSDGFAGVLRDDLLPEGEVEVSPQPAWALTWFERRRKWFIMPACLLFYTGFLIAAALLGGTPMFLSQYLGRFSRIPFVAAIPAALTTGLLLLLFEMRDQSSGMARFVGARPVTSNAMANARLKMAAQTLALSIFLVFGLSVLLFAIDGMAGHLAHYNSNARPWYDSLNSSQWCERLLTLAGWILVMWMLLWCGTRLAFAVIILCYIPLVSMKSVFVILGPSAWWLRTSPFLEAAGYILFGGTVVIGTLLAFHAARLKGIISPLRAATCLTLWAMAAFGIIIFAAAAQWEWPFVGVISFEPPSAPAFSERVTFASVGPTAPSAPASPRQQRPTGPQAQERIRREREVAQRRALEAQAVQPAAIRAMVAQRRTAAPAVRRYRPPAPWDFIEWQSSSPLFCIIFLGLVFAPLATVPLAVDRRRHNQTGDPLTAL